MKNVCIILPKGLPVPNVLGGAIETLVTDIIKENENQKKLNITCISIFNDNALELSKNYNYTKFIYIKNDLKYKLTAIKVRILNLFGKKQNTYNEVVLSKIKKEKYDYIVVEDGAYMSFVSYLKYFKKEQMILHFHHTECSDLNTDKTFSKFIAVSDFVKNNFKKNSTIKNFFTVRNGIDISKFKKKYSKEEQIKLRKKYGFKPNDFIVVFCGRLIPEKGVLELVRSIKLIKNNKIKLLIVGSINFGKQNTSHYVESLKSEIASSHNRIKCTGYIDNNDLYKFYKSSDIGFLSSICEEAAGLVIIEMMACGLPIVITNSGGAPENVPKSTIIVDKKNNIEESFKNAIEKMYQDHELRKKISKEGLYLSSILTTQKFYNDFVSILK